MSLSMSRTLTVIRLAKVIEIVLADIGLTVNQYRMLTFAEAGAPALGELSLRLVMKPPNVSILIDGLVSRGLMRRARQSDDRRHLRLDLTKAGAEILALAHQRSDAALDWLAARSHKSARLLRALDSWEPVLDAVAAELEHFRLENGTQGLRRARLPLRKREAKSRDEV